MGFFLLLFGGVVALDSSLHPTAMERRMTTVLRSELKAVRQVEVRVKAAGLMQAANGNLKRLDVRLRGFRLEDVSFTQFADVAPTPAVSRHRVPPRRLILVPERRVGFPLPVRRDPASRYPWESVIGTLRLTATEFTLADLPVDSLTVTLRQVHYDPRALFEEERVSVRTMADGEAVFHLGAAAIQAAAAKKAPQLDSLTVKLKQGRVEVSGSKMLLTTPLKFTCEARLSPVADTSVALVDGKATVDGMDLPVGVVQDMLKKLNPVFTIPVESLAPLHATISAVSVSPQGIDVHLRLELPVQPPAGV